MEVVAQTMPGGPAIDAEVSKVMTQTHANGRAEVTQNPFCGNLPLSLSDTTEGPLRRAIYHLVHSIADAKVQTILLNRVDCG
jgi:hypothetical protein